jgi:hypothetical protein
MQRKGQETKGKLQAAAASKNWGGGGKEELSLPNERQAILSFP